MSICRRRRRRDLDRTAAENGLVCVGQFTREDDGVDGSGSRSVAGKRLVPRSGQFVLGDLGGVFLLVLIVKNGRTPVKM